MACNFIQSRRLIIVLACLIGLAACDQPAPSYFPLEPNRFWQYTIKRTTMDGTTTQKYVVANAMPRAIDGLEVSTRQTLGGHQFFYTDDARGVRRVARKLHGDTGITPTDPSQTVLPENLEIGTRWRQQTKTRVLENTGPPWETLFRIVAPIEVDYAIESDSGSVSVPAGNFSDCLVVNGYGQANIEVGNYIGHARIELRVKDWYAPGVGLVRSEWLETSDADAINRGIISMELETFR